MCVARTAIAQGVGTPDARRTEQTAVAAFAVDVFAGRDVAGPYLLTWKRVHRRSEIVTVDGRMLLRDVDYALDYETGVLIFSTALRSGRSARVSYSFTPGTAQPNPPPPATPSRMRLAAWDHDAVALGLVLPRGLGAGPSAGGLLLTLDAGGMPASSSAARLVVDPAAADVVESASVRVREALRMGAGELSASFARAGAAFRGAAEDGTAGRQTLETRGLWRVARGVEASASMVEITDGAGQKSWTTVRTIGQTVKAALPSGTRLVASLTEISRENSAGAITDTRSGKLSLEQTFGARTRLALQLDRSSQRSGEVETESSATSVSLQTQVGGRLTVRGAASEKQMPDGVAGSRSLAIEGEPGKAVRWSAAAERQSGPAGSVERQGVRVESAPMGGVRLSAAADDVLSSGELSRARSVGLLYQGRQGIEVGTDFGLRYRNEGSEGLGAFRAAWSPSPALAVSGVARLRGLGTTPAGPNSVDLRVASELARSRVRVGATYATHPDGSVLGIAKPERAASVDLTSHLGALDLTGRYSRVEALGEAGDASALDLSLGWRLGAATRLAGGYRTAVDRQSVSDTYTMSLSHRLGSRLDLTLSGSWSVRDRGDLTPGQYDYRADARLGVRF